MSSLENTAYFMGVQVVAGVVLGTCIDYLFSRIDKSDNTLSADYKFPVYVAEFGAQALVDAWIADFFFTSMLQRGEDISRTVIGSAPFWFFFLGSQTIEASKLQQIIAYIKTQLEGLFKPSMGNALAGAGAGGGAALGAARGKANGPSPTGALVTPSAREIGPFQSKQSLANDFNHLEFAN